MEIEGEDGTKLILKPGDKTVFGRGGGGFTTEDLTVSRRHVSLELKPLAGGTDSDRVSFEVLGRNPVWVRKREPGVKIRTFRRSETGEIEAGDRFCVSGQLPVWFTVTRRDERVSDDGESGLDCIDGDPVKEFGFLVIGREFDQYPKNRIRDVKQWEWFLEDSTKGNSDDEDADVGDNKGKKGLSKKRRRRGKKGNEEDDDWSAESEEDKELLVKSKRVATPTYSTRSNKTKKDVNASTSSSRAQTKPRGSVDIDEDDDSDDETLGGFIVSDEEAELEEEEEEEEEDEDEEELVEEDEDED